MTKYNTGNPVGSADPRDLYDNATVIDRFATSDSDTAVDRLGVTRRTIAGIESDARDAIANAGYVFVDDYASGIELTAYNQVVRDGDGEFWRVSGSTDLPYTTTGAGLPENGAFVTVGDAALRQDLVQPVATFSTVQDMKNSTALEVGRVARTIGYYEPGDGGGNDYEIVAAGTGTDDGGSFIDLSASGLQAKALFPGGVINQFMFGAAGDGVEDDYTPLNNMLSVSASAAIPVEMLEGSHLLSGGTPEIKSGTTIIGPRACIWVQPTAGVDVCGLFGDVGVKNVTVSGFTIRGPYYQPNEAAYDENPVESSPNNHGIHFRGRDYQARQSLSPVGTGKNVRIFGMHVEGFGEDAIQVDQIDGVWIQNNTLTRCARGGVRTYGAWYCWVLDNEISYLFPGDALNGGNRMYGVTFTRRYTAPVSDYRASQWCTARGNKVRNTPYWKGLDTHGGRHIWFVDNVVEEAHIAIGIDKGGFNDSQGIVPPRYITIRGNQLIRTLPDDPNEGDGGVAGAAIFVVAHDQTDEQIGRQVTVSDNICRGWGEETRFGAIVYSNWINVNHCGNTLVGSRRAAVVLRQRFEGSVSGDVIDNVRRSSGSIQDGIAVESANVAGRIGDTVFINRESTQLRAIFLANPSSGEGVVVSAGHTFLQRGSGAINKIDNPNNDQFGPWTGRLIAGARVNTDGSISGSRGVSGVTKTGTGTYTVTLDESMVDTPSLWPIASSRGGSFIGCQADAATANTISVLTKNASGSPTDGSFILHVFGY